MIGSQVLAGAVWYWSFVKDADWIAAHRYQGVSYSWLLFSVGTSIGVAGLWAGLRIPREDQAQMAAS